MGKKVHRYKKTTVRQKRHIVQSMNTFTAYYNSAFIENVSMSESDQIIITKKLGLTIYFGEPKLSKIGIFKNKIFHTGSGMIYNEDVAFDDLSKYELLIDTVDNLISINKKYLYKIALKSIIREYSASRGSGSETVSLFFNDINKNIIINLISEKLPCTKKYSLSLYSQIRTRIKYKYLGIYSVNEGANTIKPNFLSTFDVLKSKLSYINRRKWWFSDNILTTLQNKLKELKNTHQGSEGYKIIDIDSKGNYIYEDEDKIDIISIIENHYNIAIDFDSEDENYLDAIEVLKYCYYEEENDCSKYPNMDYEPYDCDFFNKNTDLDEIEAIKYIKYFNKTYELFFDNKSEQKKESQAEDEKEDQYVLDPETYYDSSMKDEYREAALGINIQWDNFYNGLIKSILSDNIENNEFFTVYKYAKELNQYYEELMLGDIFLDNGNINEYSLYLSKYRIETLSALKEASQESEKINKVLSELLRNKKKEWKLLHSEMEKDPFLRNMLSFDYENLDFI